jgi:hypothetical protein
MSHRIVLLTALSAALATTGCVSVGTAEPPSGAPPGLVGAWRSNVQFKSGAFAGLKDLEFMYVFNLGGTMTESSNYDGAPPVPPAYGIWRTLRPNEFEARYEFYATRSPGNIQEIMTGGGWLPAGRGVLVEHITLAPGGDAFTSTLRYEAFDPQGKPIEGGGEAEGRAVKLGFRRQ